MKKLFVITIIGSFISISGYSQVNNQGDDRTRLLNVLEEMARNRDKYYVASRTEGSPYIVKSFTPATVSNVTNTALMRYDAYQDEFEFINPSKDTLALNKSELYNTITFTITNTKYNYVNYTKNGKPVTGYLIWLHDKNGLSFYKKQNVSFTKERIAKSGFDKDIPANFSRGEDTFFIKDNDKGIREFPTTKKGLLKLYTERKDALETFIKQNNIDFDKEADLIKIVDFLAT